MIVPGFSNRYPKGDDDYLWSYADCNPRPDDPVIPGLDRASLLLETCCTTLDEALSAQSRGAGRIELCADLSVGGLTPPRDLIREAVASLTIPVNVLIRPAVSGWAPPSYSAEGGMAPGGNIPKRREQTSDGVSPQQISCMTRRRCSRWWMISITASRWVQSALSSER